MSIPTTTAPRRDSTCSIVSSRVRPSNALMPSDSAIAVQIDRRCVDTSLAPDQSIATTVSGIPADDPTAQDYVAGMPGDLVLEARGLVKDYRRTRAVDGIEVVVGAGERVALLGPNGAGKTTTLLMVLGVVQPDSGSISICGIDLAKHRSRAAEQVGFAAGYLPLTERMRVREYLRMYGQLYGLEDPDPRIEEGMERFRITHLADAMGTELSSGQRTLIGIVRSTLHKPRLLVLDEPTASLDPDVALRVRQGLIEIAASDGTALLMTSHDMTDVEHVCERVLFLSNGRIVADGPPDAIAAQYGRGNLEGVFLELAGDRESASAQQTDHP